MLYPVTGWHGQQVGECGRAYRAGLLLQWHHFGHHGNQPEHQKGLQLRPVGEPGLDANDIRNELSNTNHIAIQNKRNITVEYIRKFFLRTPAFKALNILLCTFFLFAYSGYADSPVNNQQAAKTEGSAPQITKVEVPSNNTVHQKQTSPDSAQKTSSVGTIWEEVTGFFAGIWHCITWCWSWISYVAIGIWHCITWCWSWISYIAIGTWHFIQGLWDGIADLVSGLWNVVRHPILTLKALWASIIHPIDTIVNCWDALCKLAGTARGWGEIVLNVALLFLPVFIAPGVGNAAAGGLLAASRLGIAAEAMQAANLARVVAMSSAVATTANTVETINMASRVPMLNAVSAVARESQRAGSAIPASGFVKPPNAPDNPLLKYAAKAKESASKGSKGDKSAVAAATESVADTGNAAGKAEDVGKAANKAGKEKSPNETPSNNSETKGSQDARDKSKQEIEKGEKPYSDPNSRPALPPKTIQEVWDNAKGPDGKVRDPNTGEELTWDKSKPREGQWDMGHIPGKEYQKLHKDYMDGKITKEEFMKECQNPKNYRPEKPSSNRSHKYEAPKEELQ